MKDKDIKNLASFKPEEPPKKPEYQPNLKELETKYKLNLKSLKITKD